jgi:hypothetical protein
MDLDTKNTKQHTYYKYAIFHGMFYFPDPVEDIRNPLKTMSNPFCASVLLITNGDPHI